MNIKVIEGLYTNIDNKEAIKTIDINELSNITNYFEYIEDKPNRIFLDIDGEFEDGFYNIDTFEATNKAILEKLCKIKNVSIMEASSLKSHKLSYRVIYINEYCNDLATMKKIVFGNKYNKIKKILSSITDIKTSKTLNYLNIDKLPYRRGKMRCVNAWKEKHDKQRFNKLVKGQIIDTVIQYIPEDAEELEWCGDEIEILNEPKEAKEPKEPKEAKPKVETNSFESFNYDNKNTLLNKHKLSYVDLKNFSLYKQYLYLIPNNKTSYEDFMSIGFAIRGAGGVLKDWADWASLNNNNKNDNQILKGFDKFKTEGQIYNIATLKRLAKKANPDYFNTQEELFKNYFDLDLQGIKIIKETSSFVSQEGTADEDNILDENKFIILYAYLGRGKTTAIKRLIKEKGYERFLFISPRVSFSLFISQEMEIDNYTDALLDNKDPNKVFINNSKKLIISVESIQKINIDNNYQCIFLDESEAILAQFSSPTMKSKYLDSYNVLDKLIKKADKVVCADAFLTNRTINFIKSYNEPITLIKNNTSPIKREAIRFTQDEIEDKLFEELRANKKPYVCSSTKSILESIEANKKSSPELFKNSIIYFGGYKRDDKMFKETLKNINTTWKDAKWVGTTPTNTVGCSFSVPNDFDNVFMLCTAPTCSIRDMFQMSMRVRHIKENKMYFCLPNIKRNTKGTRDDIYYLSLENFENYNREKINLCIEECSKFIETDKNNQYILTILIDTFKQWEDTPKPLREIIYFNLFEMYVSNTHYEEMFYKFLDKCGYIYEKVEQKPKLKKEAKKEDKKTIEEFETIDKEKLDQMVKEYNDLQPIKDSEIDKYILDEKKMKSSVIDKMRKEKYYYKKLIRDDLPIEEEAKHFFSFINPHRKQYLKRAYDEKHSKSYIELIEKEIDEANKCKEMIKGHILKLNVINDFVKILKINNTYDMETVIKREDMENLISYVEKNKKRISNIFNISDNIKDELDAGKKFRMYYPYIDKCISNWSGCYLTVNKKDRNKCPILFKLSGINYFNIMKDKANNIEPNFIDEL